MCLRPCSCVWAGAKAKGERDVEKGARLKHPALLCAKCMLRLSIKQVHVPVQLLLRECEDWRRAWTLREARAAAAPKKALEAPPQACWRAWLLPRQATPSAGHTARWSAPRHCRRPVVSNCDRVPTIQSSKQSQSERKELHGYLSWDISCFVNLSLFSLGELHRAELPSMWNCMDCTGSTLGWDMMLAPCRSHRQRSHASSQLCPNCMAAPGPLADQSHCR